MEEQNEVQQVRPQADNQPQPAAGAERADLAKRGVAALIDGVIASVLTWAIPGIGGLVGGAYILLRDGFDFEFMQGRSVGKTVMKLRVVRQDGQPMDLTTSAMRNWTLSLGLLISVLILIPFLGWLGALALSLIAPLITVIEVALVLMDPEGRRFGDRTGGTKVIESAD